MTLTDATVGLLGLAIVAGVAEKALGKSEYKPKKKKDKPFKW